MRKIAAVRTEAPPPADDRSGAIRLLKWIFGGDPLKQSLSRSAVRRGAAYGWIVVTLAVGSAGAVSTEAAVLDVNATVASRPLRLPTLGGQSATPRAVSTVGVAVGAADTEVGSTHAVAWRRGPNGHYDAIDLTPQAAWSDAYDINGSGLIVGVVDGRATAWRGASDISPAIALDQGPFRMTLAEAVNDTGLIAGYGFTDLAVEPVVWEPHLTGVYMMRSLELNGGSLSEVRGVGPRGEIVGSVAFGGEPEATLWRRHGVGDYAMTRLGLLPALAGDSARSSTAYAVNASGAILGEASSAASGDPRITGLVLCEPDGDGRYTIRNLRSGANSGKPALTDRFVIGFIGESSRILFPSGTGYETTELAGLEGLTPPWFIDLSNGGYVVGTATDELGGPTIALLWVNYGRDLQVTFQGPLAVGEVNVARAGSTIPVEWSVRDALGDPAAISVAAVEEAEFSCSGADLETAIRLTHDSLHKGVRNLGNGEYMYAWRTDHSASGRCVSLGVWTDGRVHNLRVAFR